MKITTIASVIATAALMAAFVPASSAQSSNANAQKSIEVITIVGKRQAPNVTTACVHEVMAQTSATRSRAGAADFSEAAQATHKTSMLGLRQAIKHCIEQAAAPAETQS